MNRFQLHILLLATLLGSIACQKTPPATQQANPGTAADVQAPASPVASKYPGKLSEQPGLHNLLQVADQVYSGSEPHGEEGFASLAQLSVKTVVSVDGARPNLEIAKKHGLQYIHIPIGYDGVSAEAGMSLARAVRECEGPVYIHCHHGQHRGPAAAAVACIAAGQVSNVEAIKILQAAGTGQQYAGLWRDVEQYRPPAKDALLPELKEVAEVESFAAAMAKIDRNFDNLKLCQQAGWSVPQYHPDLVPRQESLILEEGLREAGRTLSNQRNAEFKSWLAEAEQLAGLLRDAIQLGDAAAATGRFQRLEASCKQCHAKYRN